MIPKFQTSYKPERQYLFNLYLSHHARRTISLTRTPVYRDAAGHAGPEAPHRIPDFFGTGRIGHRIIIGWAGMCGVVSLATALSIPLYMNDGSAFPHRDLIIFITFVVIFITFVFQRLTLPFVIRLTKIQEIDLVLPPHEQQSLIRLRLDTVALEHLNTHYASASGNSLLRAYIEKLKHDMEGHQQFLSSSEACTNRASETAEFQQIMSDIHDHQRKELFNMRKEKTFTDEAIRKAEHLIDLNDLRISDSVA
ncbi:hypothetical protein [Pedobacter faecalis]|uniref:hypothetical protein n=1 Tax=Pedobacter faecalis TaxID=3041495 RepID=UPI00254B1289|nr:hypothetical protein [Pedobacter sp. ELA7]